MSDIISKVGDKVMVGGVECVAMEGQRDEVRNPLCLGCVGYEDAILCIQAPSCEGNIIYVKEQDNE